MALVLQRHPQNANFVTRGDMDVPVHGRQWFELSGKDDGTPETWCYTDQLSYAAGESLTLFAISNASLVNIRVTRQCADAQIMFENRSVSISWVDTKPTASVDGCDWPCIATIKINSDWPSGAYFVTVTPVNAVSDKSSAIHLIIVRPKGTSRTKRILLITADATWNAYNDWGGSNHYEGIINPGSNIFSPILSNQRPFARGFLSLPKDAPRTLAREKHKYGAKITYPHMDWAWLQGYSKKYASAGWASYERHFVSWIQSMGYPLDIATQQDLHYRPQILDSAACVVMIGHDEYWSWPMRDAIDHYIDTGGNVARFAGNFLWQIRLESQGAQQVCHKYLAHTSDPHIHKNNSHLVTSAWESSAVNRPGHSTFGLDGTRGIYAGWGGLAAQGPGGFTLYRPDHWAFQNVSLGYGDILGSSVRIFGYEVDGLDHFVKHGLPYPEPRATLPDDLEILAMGLARNLEDGFGVNPQQLFVGDADAKFLAELRFGKTDHDSMKKVDRGSGMIVNFTKGKGQVFHAGTTEWIAGLIYHDPGVEQVTKNVLNRFLS